MTEKILPHPARLVRYWSVLPQPCGGWVGLLISTIEPPSTRTEVGPLDLVQEAIGSYEKHRGPPVLTRPRPSEMAA